MEASVPGDARHPLPRRSSTTGIGFLIVGSLIFAFCLVTCIASIPPSSPVVHNQQEIQELLDSEKSIGFKQIKDSDLSVLPELPEAHQIWFEDCPDLNGKGFRFLKRMPKLKVVNFSGCHSLNDSSIEALMNATNLERVSIHGSSQITNECLQTFAKAASLRTVMFGDESAVSRGELLKFKRARPKCSVYGPDGEVKLE